MTTLSDKERELVAIGAALASNCIPCVVYHFNKAKELGISHEQLCEATDLAVSIRKVPADQVLATANAQLDRAPTEAGGQVDGDCSSRCC